MSQNLDKYTKPELVYNCSGSDSASHASMHANKDDNVSRDVRADIRQCFEN
jgi:hypothetical protein